MRYPMLGALVAMLLPMAAHAEGDAAAGEKAFAPCKACHAFGKNGVGPDLTGLSDARRPPSTGIPTRPRSRRPASPGTRRTCTNG